MAMLEALDEEWQHVAEEFAGEPMEKGEKKEGEKPEGGEEGEPPMDGEDGKPPMDGEDGKPPKDGDKPEEKKE